MGRQQKILKIPNKSLDFFHIVAIIYILETWKREEKNEFHPAAEGQIS